MFDAIIQCQLPDLFDDGVDSVLDLLQGEVGASGISVPVAVPPMAYLRRSRTDAPRVARSRGGLYFHADDGRYSQTRLRPITADWLKGRDPLDQAAERCRSRGLALWLEVSTTLTGRVATRYPEAATKSVYDDRSPIRLCPVNPDVAEWLRALVADVSQRFSPTALILSDLHTGRRESGVCDVSNGLAGGGGAAELLAICFCESCRQVAARAGVDTEAAARAVRTHLDEALAGPARLDKRLGLFVESLDGPPFLREYLDAQRAAVEHVLHEAVRACAVPLILHRYSDEIWPVRTGGLPSASGLVQMRDVDLEAATTELSRGAADCIRLELSDCARLQPPALVRTLTESAERGVRSVELIHYGTATRADLHIAKQAIRFARRSA